MKTSFFSLVAVFLLMGVSLAQSPPEPAQAPSQGTPANPSNSAASKQTPAPNGIAPGTVIPVELSKSLDSKKSKANDKIEAKISMDVLSHGRARPRSLVAVTNLCQEQQAVCLQVAGVREAAWAEPRRADPHIRRRTRPILPEALRDRLPTTLGPQLRA